MDLRDLKFRIEIAAVKRTRQTVAEAIRTVVGGTVRHVGTALFSGARQRDLLQERR